jgi:hypothetical protein
MRLKYRNSRFNHEEGDTILSVLNSIVKPVGCSSAEPKLKIDEVSPVFTKNARA